LALAVCFHCGGKSRERRKPAKRTAAAAVDVEAELDSVQEVQYDAGREADGTTRRWKEEQARSVGENTAEDAPSGNSVITPGGTEGKPDKNDAEGEGVQEKKRPDWVKGENRFVYGLAHGRTRLELRGVEGGLLIDLVPDVDFVLDGPSDGTRTAFSEWEWEWKQGEDGAWNSTGRASGGPYELTLAFSGAGGDPRIQGRIEVDYKAQVRPREESLVFRTGPVAKGLAVARDQQVRTIGPSLLLDAWTYKTAFFGKSPNPFALIGGFGIPSMVLSALDDGSFEIRLELDHHKNHPFEIYEDCYGKTSTKNPKYHADAIERRRDEKAVYLFTVVAGDPMPVRISRLPRGYRAALSFTDHADQSSLDKMRALLFGDSRAKPSAATGGFIGHGLGLTKTVFTIQKGNYSEQLDNADYFGDLVQAVGLVENFEVGSHSPSGLPDKPKGGLSSLERLAALNEAGGNDGGRPGLVWIDHQPDTNCEAVTNLGWNPNSTWYMLQGLRKLGFKFFWSGEDVTLKRGELNLLQPRAPGARIKLMYTNNMFDGGTGEKDRLYLWPSVWTFFKRDRFYAMYSGEALDRLVKEEGVHIAHSYLDSLRRRGRYVNRSHLVETKARLRTRPEMEEFLQRLEDRQNAGDLWVTGAGFLFDHMAKLPDVSIEYMPDGSCTVTNSGDSGLKGLTLYLPKLKSTTSTVVDGKELSRRSRRNVSGRTFFWFDLKAGQTVTIELIRKQDGTAAPFITGADIEPEPVGR